MLVAGADLARVAASGPAAAVVARVAVLGQALAAAVAARVEVLGPGAGAGGNLLKQQQGDHPEGPGALLPFRMMPPFSVLTAS
jgi:hypothetical protein